MPIPEIPRRISRYCEECGGPLTFSETRQPQFGSGDRAHTTCTKCGREGEIMWSDFPIYRSTPDTRTTEVASPNRGMGVRTNMLSAMPEPSRWRMEFARQLYEEGFESAVSRASFRVYVLDFDASKFAPKSFGAHPQYKQLGVTPRPQIVSLEVEYAGIGSDEANASMLVGQQEADWELWPNVPHERYVMAEMERVVRSGPSSVKSLVVEGAIHQFLNHAAIREAPSSQTIIQLHSGEMAEWTIQTVDAPAPLVYAEARIGGTKIHIAAAGIIAQDVANMLLDLDRAESNSAGVTAIADHISEQRRLIQRRASADKQQGDTL